MARDLAVLHRLALERFRLTAAVEEPQRRRELIDLRFADPIEPEDQWPKDALDSRAGLAARGSLPAVPARPALTINKLRQPLQQVQNQQRQANLSLTFAPNSDGTSQDDAEAFGDIVRAIQADSRAQLARNWAFDRMIRCGRGFYRIVTEFASDRSFDLKIVYKRILNQFCVYFYPFCVEPDFTDAQWCFITEDVPWPEYQRRYGTSIVANYNDEELSALGNDDRTKDWATETDQGRRVRVAEYYFFEHHADELLEFDGPGGTVAVLKSELDPGMDLGTPARRRDVTRKQLCWAQLNGVEFLKLEGLDSEIVEQDGRYIPVIPVLGDESNRNGERVWTGMVRPALDAQRLFNVEASSLAEAVHLGPIAPFVGYATQFQGYEQWWAQLNTRRFPYLPVNPPRNPNEAALPIPQRNTAEQPIQAIVESLGQADAYLKATTGIFDPSLGNVTPGQQANKGYVLALQKQAELGIAGYVDHLANASMLLEGQILRDLIPKVYGKGRAVPAQGGDDDRRMVLLNTPFVQRHGRPIPVAPGTPKAQTIDLQRGEYSVSATVGKSYTTRREEAVGMLSTLAQAMPHLLPAFADILVGNMDGPGFRQVADRLKKAVPPQFQDAQDQQSPEALGQQLQQAQHVIQALTQELNARVQQLQQQQVKAEADLQKDQLDNATKVRVAEIQQEGTFAVAMLKAQLEQARTAIQAMSEERMALEMAAKHAHEDRQQARDHAHDAALAAVAADAPASRPTSGGSH